METKKESGVGSGTVVVPGLDLRTGVHPGETRDRSEKSPKGKECLIGSTTTVP